MTSNPEPIGPQVPHEFQNLLAYVTGPDARSRTAYTVELTLFRRRLALGAALLRLFCVTRAAGRPAEPVTAPDGTRVTSHDQRPTPDSSVFGHVRFERHAFTAPGPEGLCPLDAELRLPSRCYADRLREWAAYGTTDASYRESQTVRARSLGLSLSVQALETGVAEAASDVTVVYAQPAEPPAPSSGDTILVVQADGTGVPLVQPPAAAPPVRLGKGQKRGKKQEALVTGRYTLAPYRRTPQAVVAALLQDPDRPEPAARPRPVGKELRATLEGKAVAMSRLGPRVTQREGPHIPQRVALTDGAEALPQPVVTHVPESTLILDIIHATEYLWDAANALLEETHPHRTAWVRAYLEPRLAGQTDAVITAWEAEVKDPTCTVLQRQAVWRTVGYFRRNRPYMPYDAYLARGWPIGTGVGEGACGHRGKDRMEQSGMRWTQGGAQAVLDLRAVRINGQRINGHWDTSWQFHRHPQHARLYGRSIPAPALAETRALEFAA
jgi:hypothetical protein